MDELYSVSRAAKFLGLSRPTFNQRREKTKFTEIRKGLEILIPKSQLLSLYAKEILPETSRNIAITEEDELNSLFVDSNTIDLRKINIIDAYGIISLVTLSSSILESGRPLYLVVSDSSAIRILVSSGYFSELKRRFKDSVHWNSESFPDRSDFKPFLSLHFIGVRGQERKLLDDLVPLLEKQGFTMEMIGYLGWVMGELADNALTHAQGPCYVLVGQFGGANNFFEVAIGDTGKGIHTSLKQNPRYSLLSNRAALLKAFQSRVTCWPDSLEKERGKGLSDLLTIAMGNGSILRVDSNDLGLFFNFVNNQRELKFSKPISKQSGTRYCVLLINDGFKEVSRRNADDFIEREAEKI